MSVVSSAINGDLGVKIGVRGKYKLLDKVDMQGRIELWHSRNLIVVEQFKSRSHRKEIMKKWTSLYQLQNKHNVYFQIRYT